MNICNFPCCNQVADYDCGAKSLQAVLAYYGLDYEEDDIIREARTTSKYGTPVLGMERALKKTGLKFVSKRMTITEVKKYIDREVPVILLVQAWVEDESLVEWKNWWKDGHYVVAIGYDKKNMYFEDPYCAMRTYLTFTELKERWHDYISATRKKYYNHGIAVFGNRSAFDCKFAVPMK